MDSTAKRKVHRLSGIRHEVIEDLVVVEKPIELFIDNKRVLSTACSPGRLRELAYGYMFSEGIIHAASDVFSYQQENGRMKLTLRSVSTLRSLVPVSSGFTISIQDILQAARTANQRAQIFQQTGGTHVVAIFDGIAKTAFVEDISRSCALDKAIGEALISGLSFKSSLIFLSSRLPERMLKKIGCCGIPIVGCVSAPTCQAVDLARKLGISLCGFVRGERLNVYSHMERILK